MSHKSQLIVKQIELAENLNERKFSLAGIDFSYQKELELKIIKNEIDPKSYWHVIPVEMLEEPPPFTKLMRDYHTAAMVQVAFFEITLRKANEEEEKIDNPRKIAYHNNKTLLALSEILGWGFYYWAFAEDFNGRLQRASAFKAKKGGEAKATKREESDVLLSCLVKSQLENFPPSSTGWPRLYETAQILTESIKEIVADNKLPIDLKSDLEGKIFFMLDERGDVNKIYNKFSRSSTR